MLIKPDCIACILRMAVGAIHTLGLSPTQEQSLCHTIMTIPALRAERWDQTSPEVIEQVMTAIKMFTGNPDPFYEEKVRLNRTMLDLEPFLLDLIERADNPLGTAIKLAVLGNAIDLMVPESTIDIEGALKKRLTVAMDPAALTHLQEHLARTHRLVYFTDNAGEIVLDKLLIRTLGRLYPIAVTAVVRHEATLNDVTLNEARAVGLDQEAEVISNGIAGPLPGTVLARCSPAVREALSRADLIIAKGGGNFDSLDEQLGELRTDIAFLLLSKCRPYDQLFKTPHMHPVLHMPRTVV